MGAVCSCIDPPTTASQKSIELVNVISSETNPDYIQDFPLKETQNTLQCLTRRYLVQKLVSITKSRSSLNLAYPASLTPISALESPSIKQSEQEYGVYKAHASFGEYTIRLPLLSLPSYVYEGEWDMLTKTPHGAGTSYSLSLHEKYCGQFKHGRRHGVGRLLFNNGDIYEGEFNKDMMSGSGTFIDSQGKVYIGEFFNGVKEGYGKEQDRHESSFEGQFVQGLKHGQGKMIWADGRKYEGEFKDDKITGTGEFLWPDGRSYYGDMLNGKMHGNGHIIWPDSSEYEGEFFAGQPDGLGVMKFSNEEFYDGAWKHGKQHGLGTLHKLSEGVTVSGVWVEGVFSHEQ